MVDPADTVAESKRVFYGPWANALLSLAQATGDFAEALRQAGYDPLKPAAKYPASVFVHLVGLVQRNLFPDLPPQEGYRQLGQRHLASYFGKGLGRLVALGLPLLGPERAIKGLEEFPRSASNFMKVAVTQEGERHWRVTFSHVAGLPPEFFAGAVDCGLELARVSSPRVAVASSDAVKDEFDLDVRW